MCYTIAKMHIYTMAHLLHILFHRILVRLRKARKMTHDEVSHKELISLIRKHKEVFVTVNSIHDDLQVKAVKSELIKELKYELSEGRNDQWCVSYYADDNATLWIGA